MLVCTVEYTWNVHTSVCVLYSTREMFIRRCVYCTAHAECSYVSGYCTTHVECSSIGVCTVQHKWNVPMSVCTPFFMTTFALTQLSTSQNNLTLIPGLKYKDPLLYKNSKKIRFLKMIGCSVLNFQYLSFNKFEPNVNTILSTATAHYIDTNINICSLPLTNP
jgi:hypothetical protein